MKARTVYPVDGVYLNDVPATPHECTDARCTESGAFTDKPPKAKPAEPETWGARMGSAYSQGIADGIKSQDKE